MYNYVLLSNEDDTQMQSSVQAYLENFTTEIYDRRNDYRYTGQNCSNSSGWEFPSALLFTISTVAAIGFGHITPTSW